MGNAMANHHQKAGPLLATINQRRAQLDQLHITDVASGAPFPCLSLRPPRDRFPRAKGPSTLIGFSVLLSIRAENHRCFLPGRAGGVAFWVQTRGRHLTKGSHIPLASATPSKLKPLPITASFSGSNAFSPPEKRVIF